MGLQTIKEPTVDGAGVNESVRSEDRTANGRPFSDDQAQTLLVALRNVIIPLVQTVVPTSQDLSKAQMGPEAEDFLVALQKYIFSLVRNQSHMDGREVIAARKGSLQVPAVQIIAAPSDNDVNQVRTENVEDALQLDDYTKESLVLSNILIDDDLEGLEPLLARMRAEMFNNVPTRLLHFEIIEDSDILNISLLNRPQIIAYCSEKFTAYYTSLSKKLRRKVKVPKNAEYAILSHTWLHSTTGEVTYANWQNGTFDRSQPGFLKLVNFCRIAARNHDIALGWMDTVCIDKNSSSELDESIRSFFRWYQQAKICIIYLANTASLSDMATDPWFTRGWTLQELLAPYNLKFYNCNWERFIERGNDRRKATIQRHIELATTITASELNVEALQIISISRKMQWAANRIVTRDEDAAYSLMGIFDVSMSVAYGEGPTRAYCRLLKEILSSAECNILEIFNWGGDYEPLRISLLLPPSPKAYLQLTEEKFTVIPSTLRRPMILTRVGLHLPALVLPVTAVATPMTTYIAKGDYYATVTLTHPKGTIMEDLMTTQTMSYNILDATAFGPRLHRRVLRYAFIVLNCGSDETNLTIPLDCLAVAVAHYGSVRMKPHTSKRKIHTSCPITFELQSRIPRAENFPGTYTIKLSALERHGMQFLNMYI